ncbi:MAG: molybdenum cofactor biosynthesis protein MoaE [Acidobacteria bacterium]|nr:molybdenum cofactor biosynthesis protein MoaE [Acidobacteriota bacterium]
MQVRVLLFGVLKDLAGRSFEVLSLPEQATARDVLNHYAQRISKQTNILGSVAISVNQEYARPEARLRAGDEVALLPPVSGGAGGLARVESESARAFITHEKIDGARAVERIKRAEDGAAVVFEGVVRNHTHGRRTRFLEYEAYEPMALKQIESLVAQALERFEIRDAMIIHRLGRLEIGETSVFIVVASAHRAAAFDACRWLIDTLKRTVPIWKKEHLEDGAVWSEGEPFAELAPLEVDNAGGRARPREGDKPPLVERGDPSTDRRKPASNSVAPK